MKYVVDGSNLLGRLRADREGDEEKRQLTQRLASFARARKASMILFFDGPRPGSFGTKLGAVDVRFSGHERADDLIARLVAATPGRVHLVTSDRGLQARCARRELVTVEASEIANELSRSTQENQGDTDWERYFSDPKNKVDF